MDLFIIPFWLYFILFFLAFAIFPGGPDGV